MKIRLKWNTSLTAQSQADAAYDKMMASRVVRKPVKNGKKIRKPVDRQRPNYYEYIKSKRWRRKREAALKFHGRKCNVCGTDIGLSVHHKTYVRLGYEKMKDLEVLCSGCHSNHHEGNVTGVLDPMTEQFLSMF